MTTSQIYGIKNCDTMKKALKWLDQNNIAYGFHDYKKDGVDAALLIRAVQQHSWESVINRRGTTWRQLSEDVKNSMNDANAVLIAQENPSIIKRPLLDHNGSIHLGFKADEYERILK